tara:strand:+ start:2713 stop:4428 length:1716 start_codon:yes stop_codon:yes gene_type:complete
LIIFKKLRWKNFLSTGNVFTEIDLVKRDTTLVSGENGAGKSTILDALTFSLFGKSFRGINIPQLVNSVNDKDCMVEIEFSIGDKEYYVKRGLKPKIFEVYVDGKLLPQDSKSKDYQRILEERILKMSYKSFCQVVILGSSNYIPFMKLSASDRRSVVENLLDIDVFSVMNSLLKGRVSQCKEEIRTLKSDVELLKDKVVNQKEYIQKIKNRSKDTVDKYRKDILETKSQISQIDDKISVLVESIDGLIENSQNKKSLQRSLEKHKDLRIQISSKLKKVEDQIEFYSKNDVCPTCDQSIGEDHKKFLLDKSEKEKDPLVGSLQSVEKQINDYIRLVQESEKLIEQCSKMQKSVSELQSSKSAHEKYITTIQKKIHDVESETTETTDEESVLKDLIQQGTGKATEHQEKKEEMYQYDIVSVLLKDSGIKAKIIKHYLPIMNKLVNKFLTSMDFFCQFTLDETFNETIKSRHRDEFTYHSFSEGERLRIDLSLLLAWREVARLKNSVNCNLLILDEVFDSSLDGGGTEEFMKLITTMGSRSNIFVISHKSDQLIDKFSGQIRFLKKNNFSRMKT